VTGVAPGRLLGRAETERRGQCLPLQAAVHLIRILSVYPTMTL
jgi:hypothetical protein